MATPVVTSITAGALIKQLAERVGDLKATGTLTSGSTTTGVDTSALSGLNKFDTTDDAEVVGKSLFIYAGTQAGAQRRVSALNITTITATVSVAYAAALDSTSKYALIERWDGDGYLSALIQAQRMLIFDPTIGRGIMKETDALRYIQLGNALLNPNMDLFTTANVPDGWTTTNLTATSETTVTYGGARRSLKLVTDGTNVSNFRQSLLRVGEYPSSFEVTAWVWCETASELFIRVNDGTGSGGDHDSTTKHGGTGWEKLRVTVTPSAAAAAGTDAMTVAIRSTTAATAITFYVQNVWFPRGSATDHKYDLDADIGLVLLNPVIRVLGRFPDSPSGDAGTWHTNIQPDNWSVSYETVRQIVLRIGSEWNGHIIELSGWAAHAAITAVGTTWAGPIDAILEMAEAILHKQKVAPQQTPSIRNAASPELEGDLQEVRRRVLMKYGQNVGASYKTVESII